MAVTGLSIKAPALFAGAFFCTCGWRYHGGLVLLSGAAVTVETSIFPAIEGALPLKVRLATGGDERHDLVIAETPVALVYNGVSHAVMLATPCDLEDFALGFSLSEGILSSTDELFGLETERLCGGIEVDMHIAGERFFALKERRRNLAGRTGCGLCGVDSLSALRTELPDAPPGVAVPLEAIEMALASLPAAQRLFRDTGGAHGAAWVAADGTLGAVREDVGRHNALDKLLGALARPGSVSMAAGFVLVTSRASYEMVAKVATCGGSMLVAVSAPTTLAVQLAERCGLTLVGFARPGRAVVYSHPWRILG